MDKKKHFTGMLAAGAAALLFATVPTACTDEREGTPCGGERIGFAVDLWKEGTEARATQTRAIETPADTLPEASVIPLEGDGLPEGEPLYLHAVTTEGIETENGGRETRTRAARVDNTTMHEEMAVTAFVYPAADSWPAAYTGGTPSAETYMRAVRVKKSEAWNTSYYWPGAARRISFFAAAPYGSAGLTALNDGTAGNPPYLSYTVPAGVAGQKDLLVASATDRPGNTNAAEALAMKHALTAVRFVTGNDMLPGKVSKITLKNVYGTGKLPLTAAPAWYDLAGTTDFAQTFSPEATAPAPPVPDTPLTPEEGIFMMLPQTLPTGAQIEVTYTDNLTNTLRTLTASIAGSTWPMGKTVTYRISTSSIVMTPTLTVTAPAEFTYAGGNNTYTVASYATVTEGGTSRTVPAAWEAEFSEDGGTSWSSTKPAWLTAFTTSGAGSSAATTYNATVGMQTGVVSSPQNAALQAATPVNDGTNANIYDLSTKGGTAAMRTANCYIVNAAGRYKLPLVYGNAVDYVKVPGTGNNTSAYTSTASGTNVLTTFINHLGVGITNPYIYNNANCTPNNCTLVWQDEPNLVTNVALSSDDHFLEFTVGQSTIRQGNAVVAVRNAWNNVMWSWHIWVTDYVPGTGDKTITNFQNYNYTIMPVELGWCDGSSTTYAERTVLVRFKQTGTSATPQIVTVKQKAHSAIIAGNYTYFQGTRKDPIVGTTIDGSTIKNKTWYDADGNIKIDQYPPMSNFPSEDATITSCISKPNTFCTNSNMSNTYVNLWSANNTASTTDNNNLVVKTIYDPCPVGYNIPPGNAFTGFTTTGENTTSPSEFNVQQPWNNGWNFYCGLNHTGDTFFFPMAGYRRLNGDLNIHMSGYWVATTTLIPEYYNSTYGLFLQIHPLLVRPKIYLSLGHGFAVRACQE